MHPCPIINFYSLFKGPTFAVRPTQIETWTIPNHLEFFKKHVEIWVNCIIWTYETEIGWLIFQVTQSQMLRLIAYTDHLVKYHSIIYYHIMSRRGKNKKKLHINIKNGNFKCHQTFFNLVACRLIVHPTYPIPRQKRQQRKKQDRICFWSIPVYRNDHQNMISWNRVHEENPTPKKKIRKRES